MDHAKAMSQGNAAENDGDYQTKFRFFVMLAPYDVAGSRQAE
jgi:hypothetical protein